MAISIFLSVGQPFTAPQETFIASIETYLVKHGLRPRTVGRNTFTHKKPLELIADLMDRSAGALVIALEQICIDQGFERRGAPQQLSVSNSKIPTPWNQIEAAFAYAKRVPLLVIKEDTVRADGLLEGRYDWYVHSTVLEPSFLSTPHFTGIFESWHSDVRRRAGWFGYRR